MQISPQHHKGHVLIVPRRCDVLCGWGHVVLNHPGNMLFQSIVKKKAEGYANASTKLLKSRVTKSILSEVRATGARVLKKDPIYPLWHVVDDGTSSDKVMRDKTTRLLRAFLTTRSNHASNKLTEGEQPEECELSQQTCLATSFSPSLECDLTSTPFY